MGGAKARPIIHVRREIMDFAFALALASYGDKLLHPFRGLYILH
jgi:hypothetical protein